MSCIPCRQSKIEVDFLELLRNDQFQDGERLSLRGADFIVIKTGEKARPFQARMVNLPRGYQCNSSVSNMFRFPCQFWATFSVNRAINSEMIRAEFGAKQAHSKRQGFNFKPNWHPTKTFNLLHAEKSTSLNPDAFIKQKQEPCILKLCIKIKDALDNLDVESCESKIGQAHREAALLTERQVIKEKHEFQDLADFCVLNLLLRLSLGQSYSTSHSIVWVERRAQTEESTKRDGAVKEVYRLLTEEPEKILAVFETFDDKMKQDFSKASFLPFITFETQAKANLYRLRNGLPIL